MLLEGSNASTVLTWVRPDLDKHLHQIRTQIEHIASSLHIGDGVEVAAEHLTQLKFTFEALVLQGATLVVEEMISVCDELKRHNIRDRQQAYIALMDAIVIVPSYLDRLQAGHHDLPVLLLPIINELRAAYNANIVSEATLFAPSLDVPLPELERPAGEHAPSFDEPFQTFALRMRRQWESALLRWLQDQESIELLSPLHSVCETLQRRVERIDLRRLWWIAAEVIGGLLDGVTENDVHLRRLFARLHLILKTLTDGGEDACEVNSVNAVSQALLFHIAQARSGSPGVDNLRERFQLKELVPDRDVLIRARGAVTGRSRELYMSLGAAVHDELALVKDALDLELRTGKIEEDRREQSHEALLRLKDTLKMMGLGDSARSIEKLMPAFDASEDPDHDPEHRSRDTLLMGLAENLIQVESVLEEQITTLGEPLAEDQEPGFIDLPGHEQRRIRSHLLDETVISLHQVQDGVRRHFDGDRKADYTSPMEHIAGALELIGETETASLALKLRNALGNLLRISRAESTIDPDKLDSVTDAVAAFELYLAGCRDQQSNRGRFLEILKDRLDRLPVGEMEVVETIAPPPKQPEVTTDKVAISTSSDAPQPATLDPELLEVFLEEFDSVTAMLGEHIPRWSQHPENPELMADIRRGFHTLKGSGRMVGAIEIGDFAWHIETMINALLGSNIDSIDNVAIVVRLSEAVLPDLKKRLLQQPSELDHAAIEALGRQADNIAGGDEPDWPGLVEAMPAAFAALLPGGALAVSETETASITGEAAEPTLKELVRKELADNLAVLKGLMDSISKDRNSTASDDEILAIHTIAGTTALQPLGKEADIARALEHFLEAQRQSGKAFNDAAIWTIATSLAHFESCLAVHEGDPDADHGGDEDGQIEQLQALIVEFEVERDTQEETAEEIETATQAEALAEEAASEAEEDIEADEDELAEVEPEPVDTEILNIFLEEATEVLARCDTLLNTWRDSLSDLTIVQNLQREIHTFKGGARMADLSVLGNLSHSMETLLERIAGQLLPPSVSAIEALEQGCDRLNAWVEQTGQGILPEPGDALTLFEQQVAALAAVPVQPAVATDEATSIDAATEELQEIPDVVVPASEPEVSEEPDEDVKASQQIRVNADLLDSLVNSAGEISIFRSRLEQQVGHMRDNLKEFDETVSRLREQFRKFEIETETQIRSRYQQEAPEGSDEFDPL